MDKVLIFFSKIKLNYRQCHTSFFPILANITESTVLKGRQQTLSSSESIKAIANLSVDLAHWGFVKPHWEERDGVVSNGPGLYIP